ncbi:MAG: ABC transporter, partial [Spirochaetes bacterium]|nr:ABC transporter [Spirochaetota bacterium]
IYDVVLGKLMACTIFIAVMLVPTFAYAVSAWIVGSPDFGPVAGGYFGSVLLGMTFSSIGIFSSSMTKNQIISFIIGLAICLTLTLIDKFLFFLPGAVLGVFEYLGADYHFRNIAKGVIDSRDIIYFFSVTAISVIGTGRILEERR